MCTLVNTTCMCCDIVSKLNHDFQSDGNDARKKKMSSRFIVRRLCKDTTFQWNAYSFNKTGMSTSNQLQSHFLKQQKSNTFHNFHLAPYKMLSKISPHTICKRSKCCFFQLIFYFSLANYLFTTMFYALFDIVCAVQFQRSPRYLMKGTKKQSSHIDIFQRHNPSASLKLD